MNEAIKQELKKILQLADDPNGSETADQMLDEIATIPDELSFDEVPQDEMIRFGKLYEELASIVNGLEAAKARVVMEFLRRHTV